MLARGGGGSSGPTLRGVAETGARTSCIPEIVDSHHPSMLIFSSRISNMEKDANNCEIRVNKHHKNSRLKFNTTLKFSFLELKLGCFRINIFLKGDRVKWFSPFLRPPFPAGAGINIDS